MTSVRKERDALLVGAGIMSGTLAVFSKELDPIPQYVIALSGALEFTTVGGETFRIHPGDVLPAVDHTGSGHKWRFINHERGKRAYVVFKKRSGYSF